VSDRYEGRTATPELRIVTVPTAKRIAALERVAAVALEVRDCAAVHGCRVSHPLLMQLGAVLSQLDGEG
jgi:hypothetical protein